jgi:hypothetical protein
MKKNIFTSIIGCGLVLSTFAQIPNSGFENWTSMGSYSNPDGWDQLNAMTSSMSVYTCTKGTPGNPGASYLKLVSKTVSGMGVMPGIAVSGVIDIANYAPKSGFAYSQRPLSLTGSWQYMPAGSDQGFVGVYLTKWNTGMSMRDTIAMAFQNLAGMQMSWANFTVNLNYMSTATPDSAIIILSASGATPVNSSSLYVDNLAFSGIVTGIKENGADYNNLSIYPNPSNEKVTLSYMIKSTDNVVVKITDVTGKVLKELKPIGVIPGNNKLEFSTSNLARGIYTIMVQADDSISSQKLIVE